MQPTKQSTNIALYQRFLHDFNEGRYDDLPEVIDNKFVTHHSGFGDTNTRAEYVQGLRAARDNLDITAELKDIADFADHVVTRCQLRGKHVGTFLGFPATGHPVEWGTIEIWRVDGGKFVERWSEDDLYGLTRQLSPDQDNVALIRHLNDVVNERRYDDMDPLFAPDFVDHNPAWSARNLTELKQIIRSAHDALDFTSRQDLIYPADGGKVVIHITFSGHHVKTFFGQEPTGKAVSWTSIEIYRIVDQQIAERWVQADTTGLMAQLGVPIPSA
jgi:predicted ester cyclase